MKKKNVIMTIIIIAILIPSIVGYAKYSNSKKVTISKYSIDGEVRMHTENYRIWGYEIDSKKINGTISYDEIKINDGYTVDLKIRIDPRGGEVQAFLDDPEGKVIKEKEVGGTIGGFWEVNYKNIKGPYILKLRVHGENVGANIKIKW